MEPLPDHISWDIYTCMYTVSNPGEIRTVAWLSKRPEMTKLLKNGFYNESLLPSVYIVAI